ncbi:MAG TPA: ExbD/TolR family protein [bacterium]|nr:ExbD/TolR family protein [bacterium]
MAMQSGGNNLPMSEINVTPLVDVMLVLLIIFMLTAHQLEQGVKVELPQVTVAALPAKTDELVLTITKDRKIYINEVETPQDKVAATLEQAFVSRSSKDVYLRADQDVPYGFVVRVMAAARKADVAGMGLVTEPERIKSP